MSHSLGEIIMNHILDKEHVYKISKELFKLNSDTN